MFDLPPKKLILPGQMDQPVIRVEKLPTPARQVGDRWVYGRLTFWAHGGGIHLVDDNPLPGDEKRETSMTVRKWEERIDGFQNMIDCAIAEAHVGSPAEVAHNAQEIAVFKSALAAMKRVREDAVRQGDLTKPEVREHYRKHVAPVRKYHFGATLLPD